MVVDLFFTGAIKIRFREAYCKYDQLNEKLVDLRQSSIKNKAFLDEHVSPAGEIVSHAKRNRNLFVCKQRKRPRILLIILQQSIAVFSYSCNKEHMKRIDDAVNEKESKHISAVVSLISNASNRNEQHDMEINSAHVVAEENVGKNSKDLFEQFDACFMPPTIFNLFLPQKKRFDVKDYETGVWES
ncbi:KDa kinesin-related protein family [Arachis hypogaea]|nr:KDa kinesin-related protein family [Arachis hypogaea]